MANYLLNWQRRIGCEQMNEQKNKEIQSYKSLQQKNTELEAELKRLESTTTELKEQLETMEYTFSNFEKNRLLQWINPSFIKQSLRNAAAYALGRRNLKRLYSPTYKRKQASNDLKPYLRSLYDEGFTDKALQDLKELFETTSNSYMKRAIAQELALFYANKGTKEAAKVALYYIQVAKKHEKDEEICRQLAIIEAECQLRIGDYDTARITLHKELQYRRHRDLLLALANTEEMLDERIFWINEILTTYNRQPIALGTNDDAKKQLTYEALYHTKIEANQVEEGPKVSVILPAYNAADRIHIAIESMLKQTWGNIELLIVDDCSTDDTYEIAATYAEKDSRITLLQTDKNSGPYVARNIALSKATGEFVTVNDADDWSHPEKIEVQATHLIKNETIIANTSELARLTEDFYFHRRGTRGKYIFSNMSSLMFRREPVLEKIGYWDEVRFAADGEFKRRLIQAFGKEAVIDLETGPLSLPEQSSTSLTGSSAFGYAGFFMGARKEYVDSFTDYHKRATSFYYPKASNERLFPVPEPMLPDRTKGTRHIPVIIVANFYDLTEERYNLIKKQIEKNRELKLTTGLVQMYDYDLERRKRTFHPKVRELITGSDVQMLVYGEKITADLVLIHSLEALQETQQYVPQIKNRITVVIIDELPKVAYNRREKLIYNLRQVLRQSMNYFSQNLRVFPIDSTVRKAVEKNYKRELGTIRLAKEDWRIEGELLGERYQLRLRDWLIYSQEKN